MPSIDNVLIVGAGCAGAASAILLARAGVRVDLVESKDDVSTVGSGITLQGCALRVLQELGVWDRVSAAGYAFDSLGLRAPDAHGTLLVEMPDARTGGPDLPATLGAVRPELARILLDEARAAGAHVHFGVHLESVTPEGEARFPGGDDRRYDLVIGADGVRSWTRQQIDIELSTQPAGMGIWRIFGARPESVTRTDLIYGGAAYIAGYCPTSDNTLYAYLVEGVQDRSGLTPQERLDTVRSLAADYHGPWDDIREGLTDPDQVNYARFESHLLDGPWNRGRVVLAGDAVHACPPTLALGAAMALEDASVLCELVLAADTLDQSVFDAYVGRRRERAALVVDSSVILTRWLLDGVPDADVPGLMHRVNDVVTIPA